MDTSAARLGETGSPAKVSKPWRCRTPPIGESGTLGAIGGGAGRGGRPADPAVVAIFESHDQCALTPSELPRRAQAGPGPRM